MEMTAQFYHNKLAATLADFTPRAQPGMAVPRLGAAPARPARRRTSSVL